MKMEMSYPTQTDNTHLCTSLKLGPRFPTPYTVVILCSICQVRGVFRFVDIGGIAIVIITV